MSVIRYEESYDIDTDASEDDCIATNPNSVIIHHDSDSMPEEGISNNKTHNGSASVRSASIEIDIDRSERDMVSSHGRARNKTIEIYSETLDGTHHFQCCGRCYRLCCFSAFGIKITILLNTLMILLNSGLIIYEVVLILRQQSVMHTELPLWYMLCDFIITFILFFEMLFTIGAIYNCRICNYFGSGWEGWIDTIVLLLSIACCAAYYFDLTNADIDNLTMLFVRVCRDVIRIVRCLWFFKMLYTNLIRLGIRKSSMMSFRGEPLLANPAWKDKYKLQINHSPRSTCSDQRDYKGPKRVDIYDENDIHEMMIKSNNKNRKHKGKGKMYSLTPSPPHSSVKKVQLSRHKQPNGTNNMRTYSNSSHPSHRRNITRNCDEFRLDDIIGHEPDDEHDNEVNIMSPDDKSVISINSQLISTSNTSKPSIIHRQMPTQIVDLNNNNKNNIIINSYNENESGLSGFTTITDPTYWDNLKLRNVKKKSVDKQRLKDILKNLPSGSILDRESFSIEYDEIDIQRETLHTENDKISFI